MEEGLYGKYYIRKASGELINPDAKYLVLRYDGKYQTAEREALKLFAKMMMTEGCLEFGEELLESIRVEEIKVMGEGK